VEPIVRAVEPIDELPPVTPLLWRPAFHAAFVGGVFSALVMNFLGGLLGLGFIAGGTIAVYAYRRRVPGAVLGLGSGSLLGAVSGLIGFLVFGALATLEILLSHKGGELRRTFFDSLDKAVQSADPQLQQQVQSLVAQFKTPEGMAVFFIFAAIVVCVIFVFFSILGGAIGSSITRRNPQ
jgi:hypothetical protein